MSPGTHPSSFSHWPPPNLSVLALLHVDVLSLVFSSDPSQPSPMSCSEDSVVAYADEVLLYVLTSIFCLLTLLAMEYMECVGQVLLPERRISRWKHLVKTH